MRTITKEYKVYSFEELSEESQQKAIEKLYDINVDYEWWDCTYMDAETVGIKITGFDLDRSRHCTGEFTQSAENVANDILTNHGKHCETYKTVTNFLSEFNTLNDDLINKQLILEDIYDAVENDEIEAHEQEIEALEEQIEELREEFKKSILEDYSIILQKECDYLTSREAIIETIKCNKYTFLENGKLFNS
jgi:myo-inositol catabolism protein IolC